MVGVLAFASSAQASPTHCDVVRLEFCGITYTAHAQPQTRRYPGMGGGFGYWFEAADGTDFFDGRTRNGCVSDARYHGLRIVVRWCKGEPMTIRYRAPMPKTFTFYLRPTSE